jgi:tetratricopeptide (TPR) repeat protein
MKKKTTNKQEDVSVKFTPLFRRGTQLLHRQELEKAIALLEKAHALDPEHVDAIINLSGAYILTKKFKRAAALLEPLSKREPHHVMVWTNLGAALLGNPILAQEEAQLAAIAAFEQAYALNPAAPNVAYNIGLIYRDRGEKAIAVSWFQKALQANPRDKDAQTLIDGLNSSN